MISSPVREIGFRADSEIEKMLHALEDFSALMYVHGVSIAPYSQQSIRKLMGMNEQERVALRGHFQRFAFLMGQAADVEKPGDDRYFMELAAQRLGLIFDKGIYNSLRRGDIVEIYNVDMIQVFRNFAFFDVCSYSLLDLMTYEFFELYERSQMINQYLFEAASAFHTRGFDLSPVDLSHVPMHLLQEKFSHDKLTSLVKFKKAYPVYVWPQTLFGYLVVQEGEVLNEVSRQDLAFL